MLLTENYNDISVFEYPEILDDKYSEISEESVDIQSNFNDYELNAMYKETNGENCNNCLYKIENETSIYDHNIITNKNKRGYYMDGIEKYFEKNLNYFSIIEIKKIGKKNIPVISDVSIGDILYELSKTSMKEAIVLEHHQLDIKKINIALEFTARIMNLIDEDEDIIKRFLYNDIDMLDNQKIRYRLQILNNNICKANDIEELFYFDPLEEDFFERYSKWNKFKYNDKVDNVVFKIDRIKKYLEWAGLTSKKLAAARWGLDEKSFEDILEIIDKNSGNVGKLLDVNFVESIPKYLFIDCDLNNLDKIAESISIVASIRNKKITPLYCETSKYINEKNSKLASEFDDLTGEPVCDEYRVLLRNRQKLSLDYITCSLKTYVIYKEEFKDFEISIINKDMEKIVEKVYMKNENANNE
ncbi:MAG: hypothetical protein ACRDCB_04205 [Clostridium sp.]